MLSVLPTLWGGVPGWVFLGILRGWVEAFSNPFPHTPLRGRPYAGGGGGRWQTQAELWNTQAPEVYYPPPPSRGGGGAVWPHGPTRPPAHSPNYWRTAQETSVAQGLQGIQGCPGRVDKQCKQFAKKTSNQRVYPEVLIGIFTGHTPHFKSGQSRGRSCRMRMGRCHPPPPPPLHIGRSWGRGGRARAGMRPRSARAHRPASSPQSLRDNTTLQCLDISSGAIGDKGCAAVAQCLEANTALRSVDVGCNGIGAAGAAALAKGLEANGTLTALSLRDNDVGDRGCIALAEALRVNSALARLDVANTDVDDRELLYTLQRRVAANRGRRPSAAPDAAPPSAPAPAPGPQSAPAPRAAADVDARATADVDSDVDARAAADVDADAADAEVQGVLQCGAPDPPGMAGRRPAASAGLGEGAGVEAVEAARPSSQTPAPQGVFQAQHRPSAPPPQRRGSPPRRIASSPSVRTAARSPKAKSPLQVLRGGAGWEVQHNECGIGRPPL